jgi:5-dehydro-2-deoxygluconokinase
MLTPEQTAAIGSAMSQIALAKYVVYDGFKAALAAGIAKHKAGVLVDEQFGADILRDAVGHQYLTVCPVAKAGQNEFDFEYGEEFATHIEDMHPTFCHAQVQYDPEGNQNLNQRQLIRLKTLSDYLHGTSRSLFMLELFVPTEKTQLERVRGDKNVYDLEIRPRLMVEAIQQLQDAQVEPDVWEIEGLDRGEDCEQVILAARRNGRDKVSCLIRDGAEDPNKVRAWVATAAGVPGFIGFVVGRAIFWEPLSRWSTNKTTQRGAVAEIGHGYLEFVNVFEKGRHELAA